MMPFSNYQLSAPILQQLIYPDLIWRKETEEKTIYLTFDDGPTPDITEFVLDTLQVYCAKATFFCVGHNIEKHPRIFQQLIQHGHRVGNHTFDHLNGWATRPAVYLNNIDKCHIAIDRYMTEKKKKLFRPPYGKITFQQIKALIPSYDIIMWNVLTKDYSKKLSPSSCLKKAINNTGKGTIVVFHDSIKAMKNLYHVLPRFLAHFAHKGFIFKTI